VILSLYMDIERVIYSEAVPKTQWELQKSQKIGIKTLKYNDALWEVVNKYKLIAITGTHGKSTTTSMISQILKNSDEDFSAIIGTLLKEFAGKNFYSSKPHPHLWISSPLEEKRAAASSLPQGRELSEGVMWEQSSYFTIEACEYKEHFLAYKPSVVVITNIEYDHADYFKTPESYIAAYEKFIINILPGWFCVINGEDTNCQKLIWKRDDIHYIVVRKDSYSTIFPGESQESNIEVYPEIVMHIPGEHILFDAKLAYIVSQMIGIPEITALDTLEDYSGVWRRMEKIGNTENKNILMSDYGHHPTEVETTLRALKSWYPDKQLFVIFQPHQYSRTIELLEWFQTCFSNADTLIVPDIYESRDSQEDKSRMNSKIFVEALEHTNVVDGNGMENTLSLIESYDKENPDSSIILLLWAWNIDNLRYIIKTS